MRPHASTRASARASTWVWTWVPTAWSLVLALLLLGPVLGRGFVLTYDMVWVPDLAVRPDGWGLGSGLPRAVPSDAVVALVDEVLPGELVQKLVLLGALVAGGTGAARLVPRPSLVGRLVAVSVYQWTPFVAERLLLGAWPVLVAHGLLPWVVLLGRRWRETGRVPPALLVVVPLASLSASAGVATAVVLLAAVAGPWAATVRALALVAAANAPWLVTGLLHAGDARSDRAGAAVFALQGHGVLPAPLEALVLGGTWNSRVVLPSRDGVLAWLGLALALSLLLAVRGWWRATGRRDGLALVVPWAVGLTLALTTWAATDAVAALAAAVPGGGLLRDGARSLVMCAPLVAALAGHAAGRVTALVAARTSDVAPRAVLGAALALVPVMLMPDAALGLGGRLEPVAYPPSYAAARAATAQVPGDALVLPLTVYRAPAWNGRRPVLDPMPRWLVPDVVASDRLVVGTTSLGGEDPRVDLVDAALAAPSPQGRARRLAALGIGAVVTELDAGAAPDVAGQVLLDDGMVRVVALDAPDRRHVPAAWIAAAAVAWTAYAAGPGLALLLALRAAGRRSRRRGAGSSGTRE